MKISNKLFNEQQLGQFSKNMEKIQKIQDKISSGKNIIFASDDPVGAVQLSGMKDNLSRVGRFIENSDPYSITREIIISLLIFCEKSSFS